MSKDDIQYVIDGFLKGEIKEYQISALLMAIFLNGMDTDEQGYLTEVMTKSGKILDLSSIQGVKVDKHSTFTLFFFIFNSIF